MRKDLITLKPIYSSFFTCDKDIEKILKILFVNARPYSDLLKRLLVINNKDCLDIKNQDYQKIISEFSLGKLIENGYIRLNPKIARGTHEEIKTYMIVSLDRFSPNEISNHYMDYVINFEIVCYNDAWVMNDYRIRPLLICGYIDGILNSLSDDSKNLYNKTHQSHIKLTGIGQYQCLGCNFHILNEELSMYSLTYAGTHLTEDISKLGDINNE